MMVSHWHIAVYPSLPHAVPTQSAIVDGQTGQALQIETKELNKTFDVSFDELFETLQNFERLFIELDGSFVWRGTSDDSPWQIDGIVFEKDDRVWYVELKGYCDHQSFNNLVSCLAGNESSFIVQSITEGTVVSGREFIRLNWQ